MIGNPLQLRLLVEVGTFQGYIRLFLNSREAAGRSRATLDSYGVILERFRVFDPGWPPESGSLRDFFLGLRRDNLSPATLVTYYDTLKVFFTWCAREGVLRENPLAQVERPNAPKRVPRAVPRASLARLFETIEDHDRRGNLLAARDLALFRLIYDGGLRVTEACRLRAGDLVVEYNAATVGGKGGRERVVYFGGETRRALENWLALRHPGCEWVFVSSQVSGGLRPLTRNGVNQALHRWCDRAGIERFRTHDLRHSYVRHALRAGVDPEMVSKQCGHADPGYTLRVYGQSEDADRRRVHLELSPGDHLLD